MEDEVQKPRSRSNRVGAAVAIGIVVVLALLSGIAWWNARALTHPKLQAALSTEPATREELTNRLGMFTQWERYTTHELTRPEWLDVYVNHPNFRGKHVWFEGRGGKDAAMAVFMISSVEHPSQHSIDHAAEVDGLRDFCVFLGADKQVLGWVEVTGAPGLFELHDWARQRRETGEHTRSGLPENDSREDAE